MRRRTNWSTFLSLKKDRHKKRQLLNLWFTFKTVKKKFLNYIVYISAFSHTQANRKCMTPVTL